MDGHTWPATEQGCFFPVDVERTPGARIQIAVWSGATMETAWLIVEERERDTQEIDFPDEDYVHLSDENLANLHAPMLIVHGSYDDSVPLSTSQEMAERRSDIATLVTTDASTKGWERRLHH